MLAKIVLIVSVALISHLLRAKSIIIMVSEGEESWLTGHISNSENNLSEVETSLSI